MWKAVGKLKEKGILDGVQRRGTRVISTDLDIGSSEPVAGATGPLWRRLAAQIEADSLAGSLGHSGTIPSIKQLQARHGTGFRTVKKALNELVGNGMISPVGRGFRLATGSAPRASGTVLIFVYAESEQISLRYLDPALLRTIEVSLHQAGLNPLIIRYHGHGQSIRYTNHATGGPWQPAQGILGCLWIVLFPHEILENCCRRLLALSCPLAVFDNSETGRFPAYFYNNARVKFLKGAPFGMGAAVVGTRLLALGHRSVGYFSAHFEQSWSSDNWKSLKRVYDAAGAGFRTRRFTSDRPFAGVPDAESYDVAGPAFDFAAKNAPSLPHGTPALLREHLSRISGSAVNHSWYVWGLACCLEPAFRKALQDPSITAWVCSLDDEAILALLFLKRNGIAVPRRISVVGFLNGLESLKNNLASCSDNYEGILHSAIDFIIRPNVLGSARSKKTIRFGSVLVERGSLGQAPKV
jgi:hypothetical protein